MKYLVPFAGLLLIVLVFALRAATPSQGRDFGNGLISSEANRPSPGKPEGSLKFVDAPRPLASPTPQVAGTPIPAPSRASTGIMLTRAGFNMLSTLERELALSPDQRKHFEKVLLDRQQIIEDYHGSLRASKVFVPRDYDLRIAEIQAVHYERMGSVLDAVQFRKFAAILETKAQGDSIGFTLQPDMIVVE